MTVMTVAVTNISEYQHSNQIYEKSHTANNQDHLGVLNLLDDKKPLDGLDGYWETQRIEEDRVDESPNDLCPGPAEGVVTRPLLAQSKTTNVEKYQASYRRYLNLSKFCIFVGQNHKVGQGLMEIFLIVKL